MLKKLLLISLGICLCVNVFSQDSLSKILFVGNSYTYFWNLPQCVEALGNEGGMTWTIRQSTAGGVNWGQHVRGEKGLETLKKIKEGDFDVIIFQNHSRASIDRPDSMTYYGHTLTKLARESGAKVFFYMTWAREWDPFMYDPIAKKYLELGKELEVEVIPVGRAWEMARRLRPDFPLYDDDGSHQSPLGTYLNACVFYAAFTGKSPVGLPNRLTTTDANGEKLYLSIQSKNNALFCQKVAEKITLHPDNK